MTASALYEGRVAHVRHGPRPHAFSYGVSFFYLDLDELPSLRAGPLFGVERARPFSFRRKDFRGDPRRPLADVVRDDAERVLLRRPAGPVRVLTMLRRLGRAFNPVSFYYCFDADLRAPAAVVAEITNTPWSERHAYAVAARPGAHLEGSFAKAFHVSPFFGMEQRYHWRFGAPGDTLDAEMRSEEAGREVFRASLTLERRALSAANVAGVALRRPFGPHGVLAAIYWQALRLRLKRTPFFAHPRAAPGPAAAVAGRT